MFTRWGERRRERELGQIRSRGHRSWRAATQRLQTEIAHLNFFVLRPIYMKKWFFVLYDSKFGCTTNKKLVVRHKIRSYKTIRWASIWVVRRELGRTKQNSVAGPVVLCFVYTYRPLGPGLRSLTDFRSVQILKVQLKNSLRRKVFKFPGQGIKPGIVFIFV
jgi:hypothetical protein